MTRARVFTLRVTVDTSTTMRVCWLLVACVLPASCANTRPHIITIMADDMGWNDVGFHGSNQIPTPNIDALAYNGVILNRHYTMNTCTPSRTAFLTGKYPIRTGMQGYPLRAGEPRGLPLHETILPERLKQLGYVTRMIGKWHQGSFRSDYTPTQRGFDSFLGYWQGYIGYFNYSLNENGMNGLDFHRDNCSTEEFVGRYATDVFTDEAVDIIDQHDLSRPLYLHIAHLAVHAGNDEKLLEVPDEDEANRRFSYIEDPDRRLYAEMVSQLDKSVGRVVRALSHRGILNNTVIVFMSDNGAQTFGLHANWGSNWPLRGLKFTLFDGSVRGVAAVWSPAIKERGKVTDQLFHLVDWLPTLYSAAGGNLADLGLLDGVDQWSSLLNQDEKLQDPRDQILVNIDQLEHMEALIDKGWKITKGDLNNGEYDGYYGEDGRGKENPVYNISDILHSEVNKAIMLTHEHDDNRNSLPFHIDESIILKLRSQSTLNCKVNDTKSLTSSKVSCEDYCLFDLINDPCETKNIADKNKEKVDELKDVLNKFRLDAVPELNTPVDPQSDPALHDGRWVAWKDEPGTNENQCSPKEDSNLASGSGISLIISLSLVLICVISPRRHHHASN